MSCHISLSLFWSLVSPSLIKAFELIGMVEYPTCIQRMECQPAACRFERQMNHWRGSSIKRDCFGREGGFLLMILRVIDAVARIHCCGIGSRALPIT